MTRLVEGAKGMFRWVACQLDYMCELPTDKARRQALGKLPPTLFATYDRILIRVEEYNDEVKQLVRKTLLLLVACPYMCFRELCESISLHEDADSLEEDDIVSEEEVLRWCSSLVRTKEVSFQGSLTTTIEYAHFIVREYLGALDTKPIGLQYPQLKQYVRPADNGHAFRTYVYLRFLTMDDLERKLQACSLAQAISNIVLERRSYETYKTGVLAWGTCVEEEIAVGGQNYQLVQKLLLRKTPLFCLWAVEFIVHFRSVEMKNRGEHPNLPEITQLAVSTVLRSDFTTLHMAAALYVPDICQELLRNGSSPDVCSTFGSPLHYAVGGRAIFCDRSHMSAIRPLPFIPPTTQKLRTIELLLPKEITFQSNIDTPFFSDTLLSFTLSLLHYPNLIIVIATLLVSAHIGIRDCDIQGFEKFYGSPYVVNNLHNSSDLPKDLQRFVEALGDEHEPDTPRFILRQKTVDLIDKVWKAPSEQAGRSLPKGASTGEVQEHIVSLISLNDKQGLEAFLATDDTGLIRSPGLDPETPSYTALHLAVSMRSPDLIEPLLAFGLDPQAKALDDETPIHLCDEPQSAKALTALLHYATSSTDIDSWGETIWHRAAEKNAVSALNVLLSHGEAEVALKMVSYGGLTPICIAASRQKDSPDAFRVLMEYCETNRYFENQEFHRYLATSDALLTIIHDQSGRYAVETFRKHETFAKTPGGLRMLGRCFQTAAEHNDLFACEELISLGCPTEFDLERICNLTPFALAIWNNQKRMVEWFCTRKTPVSTVFRHPKYNYNCTVLDLILERPQFNHHLPLLIDRYLHEGADFSHMQFSLLRNPILCSNQQGLLILLEALQGKDLGSEERTIELIDAASGKPIKYTTRTTTFDAIVNQRDVAGQTPLHYAVLANDQGAIKILLDHGAEIDTFDNELKTPLLCAVRNGFHEVVQLLIERGARLDITTKPSGDLIILACREHHTRSAAILLDAGKMTTHITGSGRNLLNLMTLAPLPGEKGDIGVFQRFLDHGVDLYEIENYGVSAFYNLFLENCPIYLRVVLERHPGLDIDKLEGWSENYFENGIKNLVATTRNLRYVKRILNMSEILRMCDLTDGGNHSLLCRAACWNSVEAIGNIISLGVDSLEYRCKDHGTALEAAINHRHFESVKYLVRNGAVVPSSLSKARNPVISMTNPDFAIRQWLFVGRYTERKRLLNITTDGEIGMKQWSGVWIAQVALPFRLKKRDIESTLEYAEKRCSILGTEEMYMPVRRLAKLHRYKFEATTNHSCHASEDTVEI